MKDLPRHELVAVASRDASRARAYATEWDIPSACGSYEELLSAGDTDAIYVPLPNALHAEWTIAAIHAGKHVLCEKPLTTTLAEHDAIEGAVRAAGLVVAEAFMYRHHEQTQRVHDLVTSGALGTVSLVKGAFTFWLSREHDVRLDPALGGGSLWDVGCYPVSYARVVLGQEPVEATGMRHPASGGIDTSFAGQLRFPGGPLLQFDSGFRSHFRTGIEIVGSDGVLTIPNPFKPGAQLDHAVAAVAFAVLVPHVAIEHVGHGLEAAMRMGRDAGKVIVRVVGEELVEHSGRGHGAVPVHGRGCGAVSRRRRPRRRRTR